MENNHRSPERAALHEFLQQAREVPPKALELVHNIFGKDSLLQATQGKRNATSLFEKMYASTLDEGLLRSQTLPEEYKDKKGEQITAEGIPMLGRQAMLYELRKRAGLEHDKDSNRLTFKRTFKALAFDLAQFRKADEAGAGDYNLNIVGQAVNEAVEKIAETGISHDNIVVGRYGGDEFYLFLIGDISTEQIDNAKKILKAKISSAEGYYQRGGQPEKIKIKGDKIDEISIPTDEKDREIFLSFLDKNSILSPVQIMVEGTYMEEEEMQDVLHRKKSIYPVSIESIDDPTSKIFAKIDFLIKDHSELKVPYWYARAQDEKNRDPNYTMVRKVLDFYQEYLIDPLLNEIAIGRFSIQDHLSKGDFAKVFVFEAKVKEINDYLSWTYADERVIKQLWESRIQTEFRKELDAGELVVGRIGGSILLLQKKGVTLRKETLQKLRDIHQLNSRYNKERGDINHEIGFAEIDTTQQDPRETFQKIFSEPTKDWLKNTFDRILNDRDEYDNFCRLLTTGEDDPKHTLTALSAWYFTGNRWKKRIETAMEILDEKTYTHFKRKLNIKNILIRIGLKKEAEANENEVTSS